MIAVRQHLSSFLSFILLDYVLANKFNGDERRTQDEPVDTIIFSMDSFWWRPEAEPKVEVGEVGH